MNQSGRDPWARLSRDYLRDKYPEAVDVIDGLIVERDAATAKCALHLEHYPLGEVMRIAASGEGIYKTGQREAQRELELRGVRVASNDAHLYIDHVQLELGDDRETT